MKGETFSETRGRPILTWRFINTSGLKRQCHSNSGPKHLTFSITLNSGTSVVMQVRPAATAVLAVLLIWRAATTSGLMAQPSIIVHACLAAFCVRPLLTTHASCNLH